MERPRSAGEARDLLDERGAWQLVLAHGPGGVTRAASPLRVSTEGEWDADVETTPEARQVLDLFLPLRVRQEFVVGQLGQSLDGRIATESGESHYVTGPKDRVRLHRLRALVDVVVVGAGTVTSDDPRLTVREVEGTCPTRVVLDPHGRLDPGSRVFTDGTAPTLWVTRAELGAPPRAEVVRREGEASLEQDPREGTDEQDPREGTEGEGARGATQVLALPTSPATGFFDPLDVLAMLRARGLRRVLVEGGGVTVSRFLSAGALDRLHVTVAPLLLGSGRPSITLPPIGTLDDALRPPARRFHLGDDVLFDLDLGREE